MKTSVKDGCDTLNHRTWNQMFRVKYESQKLEPCAYDEQEADLKDFKSSVMNERETKT